MHLLLSSPADEMSEIPQWALPISQLYTISILSRSKCQESHTPQIIPRRITSHIDRHISCNWLFRAGGQRDNHGAIVCFSFLIPLNIVCADCIFFAMGDVYSSSVEWFRKNDVAWQHQFQPLPRMFLPPGSSRMSSRLAQICFYRATAMLSVVQVVIVVRCSSAMDQRIVGREIGFARC